MGDLPPLELLLDLNALDVLPEDLRKVPELLQGTALEEGDPLDLRILEPRHEGPKEVRLRRQGHPVEEQHSVQKPKGDPLSVPEHLLEGGAQVLEGGGGGRVGGGVEPEILPGGIEAQEELLGYFGFQIHRAPSVSSERGVPLRAAWQACLRAGRAD